MTGSQRNITRGIAVAALLSAAGMSARAEAAERTAPADLSGASFSTAFRDSIQTRRDSLAAAGLNLPDYHDYSDDENSPAVKAFTFQHRLEFHTILPRNYHDADVIAVGTLKSVQYILEDSGRPLPEDFMGGIWKSEVEVEQRWGEHSSIAIGRNGMLVFYSLLNPCREYVSEGDVTLPTGRRLGEVGSRILVYGCLSSSDYQLWGHFSGWTNERP